MPLKTVQGDNAKLVTVTRERLDQRLKEHEQTKPERQAGRKKAQPRKTRQQITLFSCACPGVSRVGHRLRAVASGVSSFPWHDRRVD